VANGLPRAPVRSSAAAIGQDGDGRADDDHRRAVDPGGGRGAGELAQRAAGHLLAGGPGALDAGDGRPGLPGRPTPWRWWVGRPARPPGSTGGCAAGRAAGCSCWAGSRGSRWGGGRWPGPGGTWATPCASATWSWPVGWPRRWWGGTRAGSTGRSCAGPRSSRWPRTPPTRWSGRCCGARWPVRPGWSATGPPTPWTPWSATGAPATSGSAVPRPGSTTCSAGRRRGWARGPPVPPGRRRHRRRGGDRRP
jgi:hypothetical protein